MSEKNKDIINIPYHGSKTRSHASISDRAAQFSPFSALVGLEDEIEETGRITYEREILGEETQFILDLQQQVLLEHIKEQPEITVVYFVEDGKKEGGDYQSITGKVKKIDEYERILVFTNKKKISLDDIIEINSDLLSVNPDE